MTTMQTMARSAALAAALTATMLTGPGPAEAGRALTIKGSDTMVILGQRWAERFMTTNPGALIQITGGGSGTGIAALINGNTDICMASRPMKPDEKKKLRDRYQTQGVEIAVARDGLSIYVNESNPIRELSLAQIEGIYRGATRNWKEVGGPDQPIVVYGRESSSGTYVYFKDHVLGGRDFAPQVQTLPGTAAVVNAVVKDPNGIGYGGAAYARGLRTLAVAPEAGQPAVAPSLDTVASGLYPLARDLYFYTRRKPDKEAKAFIDWVLSAEGQAIVGEVGYFPVGAK
jgi:phosphate transport system substrate-binding protein